MFQFWLCGFIATILNISWRTTSFLKSCTCCRDFQQNVPVVVVGAAVVLVAAAVVVVGAAVVVVGDAVVVVAAAVVVVAAAVVDVGAAVVVVAAAEQNKSNTFHYIQKLRKFHNHKTLYSRDDNHNGSK